jgi:hypothetical protein
MILAVACTDVKLGLLHLLMNIRVREFENTFVNIDELVQELILIDIQT